MIRGFLVSTAIASAFQNEHPFVSFKVFNFLFYYGGVLVSTGLQEVQIACRGWSAGHAKSRPQLQLPKLSFLWQLS